MKILENMKEIQANLLDFLDNEDKTEEYFQNLKSKIDDLKITDNINDFNLLLHLISKISNNYHRERDFYSKIEKILLLYKDDIKKNYSNWEIFNMFDNKRILLFFIEENIMTIDQRIALKMQTGKYEKAKYPQYFLPEIKPYLYNSKFSDKLPENFYDNRKKGENEEEISQLIREDKIEEFITYYNQHNLYIDQTISTSIYETNQLLLKKD